MIRFLVLRILLPLVAFLILRSVIVAIGKMFAQSFTGPPSSQRKAAPGFRSGGELKKDPVCGTYVSVEASITKKVNGEVIHFCSTDCRDKYHAA